MQVIHFNPGHVPELAGVTESQPSAASFFWLDVERSQSDWYEKAYPWLKVRLHDRHLQDTLSESHPFFYNGTDDYDLLVVRTLCPDCPSEAPTTCPVSFIITDNAVVSIRLHGDPVFAGRTNGFSAVSADRLRHQGCCSVCC